MHHDGYLTPDSTEYLTLVENLKHNGDFYVTNNIRIGDEHKLFVRWPIGYSLAIAAISILGISSFLASKVLNILIAIGFVLLLNSRFRNDSKFYYPLLLFAGSIYLLSATLSEGLYTFLFFSLVFILERLLYFEKDIKWYHYFIVFTITLSIPMVRYAGIFVFFYLSVLIFYKFFKRNYRGIGFLVTVLFLSSVFYAIYLYINFNVTGTLTGGSRPFVFNVKTGNIVKSLLGELVLIYPGFSWKALAIQGIVIISSVWVLNFKFVDEKTDKSESAGSLKFYGQSGVFYLIFIIVLGAITNFKEYNFRFLYSGSFLVLVYFFSIILRKTSKLNFFKLTYTIVIVSISYNGYLLFKSKMKNSNTYSNTIENVKSQFKDVSVGDVIINPPKHLSYIRPDLLLFNRSLYNYNEKMKEDLIMKYPEKKIYIVDDNGSLVKLK
ncbi:hypothetical protein [Croceibacter atlanticus]|uniref:hypothetical protein n=1 Tax=Croceibacter atlanticus TaxID=313588 RepID=UPI00059B8397|nr:hypothetical protein [Croceibacter atlanticus]